MEYRPLGRAGVRVSKFCLGAMMFGGKTDRSGSTRIIDGKREHVVLATEHIDLYQMHRCSAEVPLMRRCALDDLIRVRKVRYVGGSMFPSWKIVESIWVA